MDIIKNKFDELGYHFCKDTKTFIEFRTSEYGMYNRIKINKNNLEIMTDCKTGAGNRGHRNLTYTEFILIDQIFQMWRWRNN